MMMFIVILIVVVWCLYTLGTHSHGYWKKRGVLHDQPIPFIGTTGRIFAQKISMTDYFTDLYRRYPNERMVGYYFSRETSLVLRDPELIKRVLVTDFQYFYPRGINYHKDAIEPMLKNLFFADGDLWKLLRQRMTPAFTSGKLKAMFPLIVERTERLQRIATIAAESGKEVDVRDLMARYTTDFVGACGFGIDANSIDDESSPFRKLGKRIFTPTARDIIITVLKWLAPIPFKHLNMIAPEIENGTLSLVKSIMTQRNYKPSGRNDFIDLLLELKQKGKIVGESVEHVNSDGSAKTVDLELDDLLMAAQVFVFFAAGFETSSSATSFTLHQLAFHPEAQAKCQEEIDAVLKRHDGKLSYDAVNEMKYLRMCFSEGMRLFPSLGFLIRKCAKPYTFPGTKVDIKERTAVIIPVQALHTDGQYFEDPEKFRPERFEKESSFAQHVYLPFGEGPRACIGQVEPLQPSPPVRTLLEALSEFNVAADGFPACRIALQPHRVRNAGKELTRSFQFTSGERLGLMQSLAGLAALLRRFSVAPSASTARHPLKDPTAHIIQSIKGGVPLALTKRIHC